MVYTQTLCHFINRGLHGALAPAGEELGGSRQRGTVSSFSVTLSVGVQGDPVESTPAWNSVF